MGEMECLIAEIFPRVMLKSVWSGVRLGFGSPFCLSWLIPLSLCNPLAGVSKCLSQGPAQSVHLVLAALVTVMIMIYYHSILELILEGVSFPFTLHNLLRAATQPLFCLVTLVE